MIAKKCRTCAVVLTDENRKPRYAQCLKCYRKEANAYMRDYAKVHPEVREKAKVYYSEWKAKQKASQTLFNLWLPISLRDALKSKAQEKNLSLRRLIIQILSEKLNEGD